MIRLIKNAAHETLRGLGYELCRLETCKEAQTYKALSGLGQLSVDESRMLGNLVTQSDPSRPIIEIGTLFGFSTLVIALFKERSQQLITVDNYSWNPLGLSPEAHYETTRTRLAELIEHHNVHAIRQDKSEFYRSWHGQPPPALFFCDADHAYEATRDDLRWARSVGATIICGDDYDLPHEDGVRRAVDELGGPRKLVGGLFLL
jgi:methyltransferase family protein